jgi:hypothetical protein
MPIPPVRVTQDVSAPDVLAFFQIGPFLIQDKFFFFVLYQNFNILITKRKINEGAS